MDDGRLLTRDGFVILVASFFNMACAMLINPLITGFSGSVGAGAVAMGVIGAITSVCALGMRPVAGNLADRMNRRTLSVAGAAAVSLSVLGCAVVQGVPALVFLRVVNGLGASLCSVCLATWYAESLPPARVGQAMGLFGIANAFGMALGPATGIALYQNFGYRVAFALAGVLAACAVGCVLLVRGSGVPSRAVASAQPPRIKIVDMRAVPFAVVIMLFTMPYIANQYFLVGYVEARGIDVAVSAFFPIYAAFLFVMRISLGRAFDRVRFWVFLIIAAVCATAAFWLLSVMQGNLAMVGAAACMAGGYGLMCSVCQAESIKAVGTEHSGLGNSTYYMGLDLGMALGPIVGGFLMEAFAIEWFFPALMITAPLPVLAYAGHRALVRVRSAAGGERLAS